MAVKKEKTTTSKILKLIVALAGFILLVVLSLPLISYNLAKIKSYPSGIADIHQIGIKVPKLECWYGAYCDPNSTILYYGTDLSPENTIKTIFGNNVVIDKIKAGDNEDDIAYQVTCDGKILRQMWFFSEISELKRNGIVNQAVSYKLNFTLDKYYYPQFFNQKKCE